MAIVAAVGDADDHEVLGGVAVELQLEVGPAPGDLAGVGVAAVLAGVGHRPRELHVVRVVGGDRLARDAAKAEVAVGALGRGREPGHQLGLAALDVDLEQLDRAGLADGVAGDPLGADRGQLADPQVVGAQPERRAHGASLSRW